VNSKPFFSAPSFKRDVIGILDEYFRLQSLRFSVEVICIQHIPKWPAHRIYHVPWQYLLTSRRHLGVQQRQHLVLQRVRNYLYSPQACTLCCSIFQFHQTRRSGYFHAAIYSVQPAFNIWKIILTIRLSFEARKWTYMVIKIGRASCRERV
jgi:hypothetical protein